MMLNKTIISKDNDLIKKIVKLASDRSYRYVELSSIVYGEHLVEEAINAQILQHLIITNSGTLKYKNILAKIKNQQIILIDDALLKKINILDSVVDIIGLVEIKPTIVTPQLYKDDCVILESIQDPGNLGAILRLISACGIKSVIISENSVDVYNPKVLRASQGSQFKLSIYQNINLSEFIINYEGQVIATLPDASDDLYILDLTKTHAWVFGNEGSGLSPELLSQIVTRVKIPMPGNIESLNIAVASGICLFETVRQRLFS